MNRGPRAPGHELKIWGTVLCDGMVGRLGAGPRGRGTRRGRGVGVVGNDVRSPAVVVWLSARGTVVLDGEERLGGRPDRAAGRRAAGRGRGRDDLRWEASAFSDLEPGSAAGGFVPGCLRQLGVGDGLLLAGL